MKSEVTASQLHLKDKVIEPDLKSFQDANSSYQLFSSSYVKIEFNLKRNAGMVYPCKNMIA